MIDEAHLPRQMLVTVGSETVRVYLSGEEGQYYWLYKPAKKEFSKKEFSKKEFWKKEFSAIEIRIQKPRPLPKLK